MGGDERKGLVKLDSARTSGGLLLIAKLSEGEYKLSQGNLYEVTT